MFKAIFSDRTAEVHVHQKLPFVADGPGIFKAIFSDRTAVVHVYQKLLFDAVGLDIFKAIFSDRTAEVYVYQNCSLMRVVQTYSVCSGGSCISKTAFDADDPGIFKAIYSDRKAEVHVYQKLLFDVEGVFLFLNPKIKLLKKLLVHKLAICKG